MGIKAFDSKYVRYAILFVVQILLWTAALPAAAAALRVNNRFDIYAAVNYPTAKAEISARAIASTAPSAKTVAPAVLGPAPGTVSSSAMAANSTMAPAVITNPILSTSALNGHDVVNNAMESSYYRNYGAWPNYTTPTVAAPYSSVPYYGNPGQPMPGYYGSTPPGGMGMGSPSWYGSPATGYGVPGMGGGSGQSCVGGNSTPQTNACQATGHDHNLINQLQAAIRQPGALKDCNFPANKPGRVVFGFSGLWSHMIEGGVIRGMVGNASNVSFNYRAWDEATENSVTPTLVCAYAAATKPYASNGHLVYNSIAIVGHSFGGNTARDLAVALGKAGVAVDTVVTADPRQPTTTLNDNQPNWARPCNVARFDNYWEPNSGILRGFPVPGVHNIEICGEDHMDIPSDRLLVGNTQEALNHAPVCRGSFEKSIAPPLGACNNASASQVYRDTAAIDDDIPEAAVN